LTRTFENQHIVVTGASTGMGRATAHLLARRGARVFLIARRQAILDEAIAEIRGAGGIADACAADVSDKSALLAAIDAAENAFGPIDALYSNAGTGGQFAPFTAYSDEMFETVLRTNLYSAFWAMKRVLPAMIERRKGAILVTGSLSSERGMAFNPGYVASKHGVLGLARAAALEVAPHNVRVNCIVPGFIETPMLAGIDHAVAETLRKIVPQGRIGSSEELAEVAAFLLSDAASHVTGQSWAVDGGVLGTLAVG
jgi:NAD(P)-dependent dehydrogenase (short-subunit alcohol dehydrogenase family)